MADASPGRIATATTPQSLLKEEIRLQVIPRLKSLGFRDQGRGIWHRNAAGSAASVRITLK